MTVGRRWDNKDWPEWLNAAWNKRPGELGSFFCDSFEPHTNVHIATLEGVMHIDWGDWIIQEVNGAIYSCKFGIFDKTYEPVE